MHDVDLENTVMYGKVLAGVLSIAAVASYFPEEKVKTIFDKTKADVNRIVEKRESAENLVENDREEEKKTLQE